MPSRDRMEDKLPLITPINKNRKFFSSPVQHCKQLVVLENKYCTIRTILFHFILLSQNYSVVYIYQLNV